MAVLIIGGPDEYHAAHIHHHLSVQGEAVYYLDTRLFPEHLKLSMGEDAMAHGWIQPAPEQPRLAFSEIQSVYWRWHYGVNVPASITEPPLREAAYREIESILGSLCRVSDSHLQPEGQPGWLWVNSAQAIAMHRFKHYQLQCLSHRGLRIPKTLVTNEPQAVRQFAEALEGNVIFKPIRGGAHTAKLTPDDLTDARLAELAKAPVQFQEMIPGVDVRVYKIGEQLFAAEIRTDALDFREDPDAQIVPVELPEDIALQCHQLAEALMLTFSGIDIRRTPAGEYVFIEGNPSPMFAYFEEKSGYPITDTLVALLKAGTSDIR